MFVVSINGVTGFDLVGTLPGARSPSPAREKQSYGCERDDGDDTEFTLLYDLNSSENLEFPYWKYGGFDLDSMTYEAEFRFFKNDIYLLGEVLDIPDIMKCPNGVLITHFQKVIQP